MQNVKRSFYWSQYLNKKHKNNLNRQWLSGFCLYIQEHLILCMWIRPSVYIWLLVGPQHQGSETNLIESVILVQKKRYKIQNKQKQQRNIINFEKCSVVQVHSTLSLWLAVHFDQSIVGSIVERSYWINSTKNDLCKSQVCVK